MLAELETLRDAEGNTMNSSAITKASKTQCPQLMHWGFTFNNYRVEDIETLETFFKEKCEKFCFQEEIGKETGTPHLQGVISMKKRARWTEFGLPKQINWKKVKDVTAAYKYCSKEDTRNGRTITKNFKLPVKLRILQPSQLYKWQLEILKIIDNEPDERSVYWFWSLSGGVGKSSFAKFLVHTRNCVFIDEGRKADIMKTIMDADMDRDKCVVIFDIPRDNGNNVSYKSIESIKNGMIFSSKYESGQKLFNSPHVICFANEEPKYKALSLDRWKVCDIDLFNVTK